MTYCVLQDLIDRFGNELLVQLTDRTNIPATTIDETVVDRAIGDAGALIDTYLAKRYTLPLADTPPVLTKFAADLARYFLTGDSAAKGTPVEAAYRDALDWLADVAEGTVVLAAGGETEAPAGGGQVEYAASCRVFTRDSLRRF